MSATEQPSDLLVEVLGELRVQSEGTIRALPRSRKTRALLAYLAITGRQHRRDFLCDLLWDVTDDRRAALRWSLSKLRRVLGDASDCVVASRDHVQLVLPSGCLDLSRLRRASRDGFDTLPTATLESLAGASRGDLLEGMLLPDFDAFEGWLEGERTEARAMLSNLRRVIVERLSDDPARAFAHARAWLHDTPSDEAQRWVDELSSRMMDDASSGRLAPVTVRTPDDDPVDPSTPGPPATPLVGRAEEMQRLVLAAEHARDRRAGRLLLLVGEPGMGKTRVLEELRRRLHPQRPFLLEGVFHEAERNRPLAPFLDATREELPELHAPPEDGAASDREELFDALAKLVRRGAEERGLGLLLLDDAHLCDPSSSELLHYIVRTAARTPLLTVLACRPAELEDNPELSRALTALRRRHDVEEVPLAPLDPEAVAALVDAEGAAGVTERLLPRADGNPLLAIELARATVTGDEEDAVPRSFSDLVLARLASLPGDAGAVVRWASVFDHGPVDALQAACEQEAGAFLRSLETAIRYRLVRLDPSGAGIRSFTMAHALVRRAVYDSLSPVRRAAMHRVAAQSLELDGTHGDRTSLVAYHATRADRPDLAAAALVRGAEHCAAMGAVQEASDLADRALSLLPDLEPTTAPAVELDALLVLEQVRRPEDGAGFAQRVTELGMLALDHGRADDARRAFEAASHLRWTAGDKMDGYGLARRAWQASRAGDARQRIRGRSLLALCLVLMEKQLPEAQAILQETEALGHRDDPGPEPAELALARGLLHLHAGRLDEARRDAADARTLARLAHSPVREATALELTLQVELLAGRAAAVAGAASTLEDLATRIREGGEEGMAHAGRGLAQEGIDDARPHLECALRRLQLVDDKRRLAWVANRWARRERQEGDAEAARRLAAVALEAALAVEAQSEAAMATCELMASVVDDAVAYGRAEQTLAELEASSTLSHEARLLVEQVTALPTASRHEKGAQPWSS